MRAWREALCCTKRRGNGGALRSATFTADARITPFGAAQSVFRAPASVESSSCNCSLRFFATAVKPPASLLRQRSTEWLVIFSTDSPKPVQSIGGIRA